MKEIQEIKIEDKNYPKLLKQIPRPPQKIYFKGSIKTQESCFAVVGTRRPSSYGKQATIEITKDLSESGLTIVSGLAPGIDTFAHQVCVERKGPACNALRSNAGRTIAVLGTGLDEKSLYPKSNLELSRKIIETGGCLISELPPGTPGSKFTFPKRNRIIAGLSLGILVVEAKEKSGALITANYGFQQNKMVFAVPGPIYSLNSRGPNKLIKQGAKLVESANDILKELKLPSISTDKKIEGESAEEKLILETLKEESLHIDKIIEETKLSAQVISGALALMEISGKVKNLGGNVYAISH